jgi:hypothetical protein
LIRHAAIYANDFDYEEYIEPFIQKLQNTSSNWQSAGPLAFLSSWQSPIADQDEEQLTQVGSLEAQTLGVQLSQRYLGFRPPPKVWSSTAERTTKSATSFIEGLVRRSNETQLVEIAEGKNESANSLTPYSSCPAYSSSRGSEQSSAFSKQYTAPIIARFQAFAPGFNFTTDDIIGMQELCGYETVIRGGSPFCDLSVFSPAEWLAFEYTNDLMYFQNTGYGNPVSGVIGFPWLNATAGLLLADSADQDLYVSFTHRELPPTVLVAMGLFNNSAFSGANDVNATMPSDTINYNRAWISSRILPFLTNIAVEKMECDSYGYAAGDFFRVLVNASPQPLSGCVDGPGQSCSNGAFGSWVAGRGELFGGFSEQCGVQVNNATDTLSIYSSG